MQTLEDGPGARWTDPDNPDPMLDAAYRSGVVPPPQRWQSDFVYRPIPFPDALTVLETADGKRLAKRILPDGTVVDYDKPYRFNLARLHVRNLDDIEGQLRWL